MTASIEAWGSCDSKSPDDYDDSTWPLRRALQMTVPVVTVPLLSLGLLTTAGFIDFGVHGRPRSVAYFEMLPFAGGAALVVARRAFSLIDGAVGELRRDREG